MKEGIQNGAIAHEDSVVYVGSCSPSSPEDIGLGGVKG